MTVVRELRPGALVTKGGDSAVFIMRTSHPVYHGLQLVVWRLSNGTVSFDALLIEQDVGDVTPSTPQEQQNRLVVALTQSSVAVHRT